MLELHRLIGEKALVGFTEDFRVNLEAHVQDLDCALLPVKEVAFRRIVECEVRPVPLRIRRSVPATVEVPIPDH